MEIKEINNDNPDSCVITWELANYCNYRCSYCPPELHNGDSGWPDIDNAVNFLKRLSLTHTKIWLNLSGGEPSKYPYLETLLNKIPENIYVEFNTTGSQNLNWWKRYISYFDEVAIAYHANAANDANFIQNAKFLSNYKNISILILLDLTYLDKIDNIIRELANINISYKCKKIYPQFNSEIDYTGMAHYFQKENNVNYTKLSKPSGIIVNNSLTVKHIDLPPSFFNWKCYSGIKRLHIDSYGDIFNSGCRLVKYCNIKNYEEYFLQDITPIICTKSLCSCSDDRRVKKHK